MQRVTLNRQTEIGQTVEEEDKELQKTQEARNQKNPHRINKHGMTGAHRDRKRKPQNLYGTTEVLCIYVIVLQFAQLWDFQQSDQGLSLILFSIAVIKHFGQKQIRNERAYLAYTKISHSVIEESLGRNSIQEPEAENELDTMMKQVTGLLFMACAACFILYSGSPLCEL